MHEVSLMVETLSIVKAAASAEKITEITKIKLRIGKDLLVLNDSLQFAFEYLKDGDFAESAVLIIEEVKGRDLEIDYFEGE